MRYLLLPAVLVLGVAADAPLAALSTLQPGKWQLTSRDGDFAARSLCLGNPRVLLQLRQPGPSCQQFVIANQAGTATVHYSCSATSNGQTTIRAETPRLAQIQTQGLIDGAPFDLSIEARRVGACEAVSQR